MMKSKIVYPAIFTYNKKDKCYEVDFIDFDCSTFGKDLNEAFFMAEEALGLYFENEIEYPEMTEDINNIKVKSNQFVTFIGVDMLDYYKKHSNKAVKKTLTIPEWLNILAENENINFSQVLQEALKERLVI
ncbi:MAG: type II toxin-antitoxin system HicB family antitoxin [Clostridia bacterium]|nr:type II toxin-antitoxin system HicB family antitoxin [Clostridia bacterium]